MPGARVTGVTALRQLGVGLAGLGDEGKEIRRAVRTVISAEQSRLKRAAQQAARDIPSKGGHPYVRKGAEPPPPLRESIAKSVRSKLLFSRRSDVCEVRAVPNKMRDEAYNLAAFLEGRAKGSHPLFGHPPSYYIEPHPWFHPAVDPIAVAAGAHIVAAVNTALASIERISKV